jgi:competence protein ComEC
MALVLGRNWLQQQWQGASHSIAQRMAQAANRLRRLEVGGLLANSPFTNTVLGLGGVAGVLTWWIVLTQPDGYLHIHFLDVGQGDGILIETPSGRQVLVDGGRDPQLLFNELGEAMPFWDRSLDLLLLTHADADHMDAQLAVPARYSVAGVVASAVTLEAEDGQPWAAAMAAAKVPIAVQGAGGWLDLGDGAALWILWPPPPAAAMQAGIAADDKNEHSLVALLVYGELRLLLTGDAGLPTERALLQANAPLGAGVLKVGHHGSNTSTGPDFVNAVNPAIAIIQVGKNNGYDHPHATVLDTLAGRTVLRTDDYGQIHLWSDGQKMWIETERGQTPWYNASE